MVPKKTTLKDNCWYWRKREDFIDAMLKSFVKVGLKLR